jgi:hypothetical protein
MQADDCISGWCGRLCNLIFVGEYIDEAIAFLATAFIAAFI